MMGASSSNVAKSSSPRQATIVLEISENVAPGSPVPQLSMAAVMTIDMVLKE